jgi:dipeptidyl aminopeptidase/acylaminoacyl peptidase
MRSPSRRRMIAPRALCLLLLALAYHPLVAQETTIALPAEARAATARSNALFTIDDALDMRSVSVADVTKDGRWIAATVSTRRDALGTDYFRDSDPTYVRDTKSQVLLIDATSGAQRPIFPGKEAVKGLVWSPDGSKLAMLRMHGALAFEPVVWERASGKLTTVKIPAGRYVAENSDLRWLPDGSGLVFSLRTDAWRTQAQAQFARQTKGPIFVQSSADPFLAWDDIRRLSAIRSVASYDVKSGRIAELVPERRINSYTISRDGSIMTFTEDLTEKTVYDAGPGAGSKLWVKQLAGGEPRVLYPTTRGLNIAWAADGKKYAYSRDGRVFVASIDDTTGRQVAGPPAAAAGERRTASATPDTSKAARDSVAKVRFTATRFSPAGDVLLISNREGQWLLDLASGAKELMLPQPDSTDAEAPRTNVVAWSEDGRRIYLGTASRTKWERGILLYDRDTKQTRELIKDGRTYSGLRLLEDGKTALINIAEGNRPAEIYLADLELKSTRKVADANPQLRAKQFGRTELLTYLDADGKKRYGVVYYPSGYVAGRTYPTVFNVYEEFFDDTFDASANILTANGYVVVKPSVGFDIGYPGEAWVKGVTAAANKLIEMGVADSARLGVHGTSYGGYATNLLITQTQRFKAAINVSGKVDLISFYTDSPRLGVRNITAAERSQDRIGATLWQQPQKYVQHSAVMFADRITTPLLIMTGDQDQNVPARNSAEMYYALRRLGKDVVWVNYMNSGHGTPGTNVDDFTDWHTRILQWYDKYLKADQPKKGVATSDQP